MTFKYKNLSVHYVNYWPEKYIKPAFQIKISEKRTIKNAISKVKKFCEKRNIVCSSILFFEKCGASGVLIEFIKDNKIFNKFYCKYFNNITNLICFTEDTEAFNEEWMNIIGIDANDDFEKAKKKFAVKIKQVHPDLAEGDLDLYHKVIESWESCKKYYESNQ
jgi:hypothetical protein